MKKKILTIFFLLLLNACGFKPIYNTDNSKEFSLEILSIEGDIEINNYIKRNLKFYINSFYKKKFTLKIVSNYEKNILTKNKLGQATDYELIVQTNFEINSGKNNRIIELTKKFNIKDLEDSFQEKEYERIIKNNLVNIITNDLINKISLME